MKKIALLLSVVVLGSVSGFAKAKPVVPQGPQVTFVELGSVSCMPCKMMQPVMAAIENDYAGVVKVIFYDVSKPENRSYAEQYGIRVIPTQVFLDKSGKEFARHEGFYPKDEIVKLFSTHGVKNTTASTQTHAPVNPAAVTGTCTPGTVCK